MNYRICNFNNLYYNQYIKNLHIVSISVHSYISLYLSQETKYLKNQIYRFYWIFKKKYKLLIYDIYWSLELNKQIYNCLIYECKRLLYKKDIFKRLRLNNHIYLKQFIQKLFNLLAIFFEYYNILVSFTIVKKMYKLFSNILYYWYKKKYKRIYRLKLYNNWNSKFFIKFISNIRVNLLYITFLKQINR
uniref:hypothetical protein n=1 Tax=Gracilaria flabelliformis subsp. simplex TaxID=1638138 RepID=UPI001D0FE9A2|nr:hypothetical protein LK244_pgp126 [Gracilaria flabelliformis subsp. simplex]UAD85983.1 hypothetical protein [Gracilaria flabelliformis subsp. simplex]